MSNIDTLKNAFAEADKGNAGPLVEMYDDNMTWAGFTTAGALRLYTKAEFLGAFGILAEIDESKNEVVEAFETPEGLVVATLRAYRRKGDDVLDFQMVMTHRFVDGKVTHGTDMVPAAFEEFWERHGLAS